MEFTKRIELDLPYHQAVDRVKDALKEQGFGVLTEIDIRQTLKDKLDVDTTDQVILGACNPGLAHRALQADPRVAALLPCNVVVRTEGDRTVVEALDPKLIAEIPDEARLQPIAEEAGALIGAALEALSEHAGP
jgi:uncharacterized protein (DUF302 family)